MGIRGGGGGGVADRHAAAMVARLAVPRICADIRRWASMVAELRRSARFRPPRRSVLVDAEVTVAPDLLENAEQVVGAVSRRAAARAACGNRRLLTRRPTRRGGSCHCHGARRDAAARGRRPWPGWSCRPRSARRQSCTDRQAARCGGLDLTRADHSGWCRDLRAGQHRLSGRGATPSRPVPRGDGLVRTEPGLPGRARLVAVRAARVAPSAIPSSGPLAGRPVTVCGARLHQRQTAVLPARQIIA